MKRIYDVWLFGCYEGYVWATSPAAAIRAFRGSEFDAELDSAYVAIAS